MNLIFDARHMARRYTGLGRYTGCLLEALLMNERSVIDGLEVIVDPAAMDDSNPYWKMVEAAAGKGLCMVRVINAPPFSFRHHIAIGREINSRKDSVYFYPHFDLPVNVSIPSIFVVHDLFPLKVPGYMRRWAWLKKKYFLAILIRSVRAAIRCIAVSETTRTDILSVAGNKYAKKISVSYEAPTSEFGSLVDCSRADEIGPYLLYVGDRRPHKNLQRIVDVFCELKSRGLYKGCLVLVGSSVNYGYDLDEYIKGNPYIHIYGNVSDADLACFYSRADSLVFMSLYEGFGLPVVEAARYGRRVIVSDGGSLPEIAPSWACVVPNNFSIAEAALCIAEYLSKTPHQDVDQYMARFSWSDSARRIFSDLGSGSEGNLK